MIATMNNSRFWASAALLALAGSATAIAATPTVGEVGRPITVEDPASSCTASLITKLCDYPSAGPEFSVAGGGKEYCWEYCHAHPPCDFVIFAAGNPYLKTGTCWLYPGKTFDASQGDTDCGNPWLSVFSKPVCNDPAPTGTTVPSCEATAAPSPVASVCGYPPPDSDCFYDCYASSGASNCLSICAEADSCAYAVFNPGSPSHSQYSSGNCWVYPNGTYDAGAATACTAGPEQFVYNNACPKPKPSSSSLSSSATTHPGHTGGTGTGTGSTGTGGGTPGSTDSDTPDSEDDDTSGSTNGGTTGSSNGGTTGSTNTGTTGSNTSGTSSTRKGSGKDNNNGTQTAEESAATTTAIENSASAGFSLISPLAVGAAVLLWQALL